MDKKAKLFEKKHQIIGAIVVGMAVVMFWRGMWGMLDLYLFPSNPLLSYSTSLIAGLLILFVTHKLYKELT